MVTGQSALRNVEEEPKPGPDPAQILLLFTVEMNVQETALRLSHATLKTARFMADGVNMVTGQSALRNVEEEPKPGPDPAQILLLFTVEMNVQETALRLSHATLKTARFMDDGVNMETGQSALRNVEEEPKPRPDPAQILLLFTVEMNVQETALRLSHATLKTAPFMADGVNMEPGQSALRNVEEEPKPGPDPAQILLLFTVEINVQETALRLSYATLKTARFMADGVNMVTGQSALRNVEEEPKPGPDPAQILLLFTVEMNVQETALRLSHATLKTAPFMADGVNMEPGQSVLMNVEEEPKPGPDSAKILLLFTVEMNVQETTLRLSHATLKTARFMADGVNMETGQSALRNVEEEPKPGPDPAQILLLFTVEMDVQETALRLSYATLKTARFMADGVNMETGQSALRSVEEEPKPGPDPAQILLLFTVEMNVQETALRLSHATLKTAPFMADGVNMEPGQSALTPVKEEPKPGPDPAQILLLFTVERNVQETALRLSYATLKTARFMADGVNMEPGQSVLMNVEEEPKPGPDPAQILLLFTVEMNVQETALRLSHATLKTARFMADGVNMEPGQSALRNVEEEPKPGPDPAQILLLFTVERNVQETALRLSYATLKTAQFMADGVNMEPGQSALRPVKEETKPGPDPAQSLLLFTMEMNVQETALRVNYATHKTARLMADGVNMEPGQSVLRPVEEEPKNEPEPAQSLLLLSEEQIVREKVLRNRNAKHKTT